MVLFFVIIVIMVQEDIWGYLTKLKIFLQKMNMSSR